MPSNKLTKSDQKFHHKIKSCCEEFNITEPESYTLLGIGEWLDVYHSVFFKYLKGKTIKRYMYLVTFTLKTDSIKDALQAEEFVKSQAERTALQIKKYAYVKELTKQGTPHFHVVVETLKPLKRNRFQYYEKLFGSVDISRTKGQTTQEALQYISKDSTPVILL